MVKELLKANSPGGKYIKNIGPCILRVVTAGRGVKPILISLNWLRLAGVLHDQLLAFGWLLMIKSSAGWFPAYNLKPNPVSYTHLTLPTIYSV